MQSRFISYKNSSIHYCLFGTGKKLLFCFHGYGEDATGFACLAQGLGTDYTLVAIDMPFHGQTQWKEGFALQPCVLVNIMIAVSREILQGPMDKITLLGYSMGGRVVLQLLQEMPQHVTRAVLVAPDGLHKNPWYFFSTQTALGNRVFKRTMYNAGWLLWLLKVGGKYKLAHPSIIKVAHYYLDNKAERIKLYERWTTMRRFKPKIFQIKQLVRQNNIALRFLFGKYDNIILSKRSNVFKDDTNNVQVTVINAGHRLMQAKYAGEIIKLFYQ
ncbi:MAG TPA: alpha/beta hydrolase [Chitinophagaceae bacterium]|nr:alpha/beta hydrolase [Chitinophagaceae bacterium]